MSLTGGHPDEARRDVERLGKPVHAPDRPEGQRRLPVGVDYPATRPELVQLTTALHALANDADARAAFACDAAAFARHQGLDGVHATLLAASDFKAIVALGVHPLVPFLARMQIERERK